MGIDPEVWGFIAFAVIVGIIVLAAAMVRGLCAAAGRSRPRPPIAATAPGSPAPVPSRAVTPEQRQCMQRGHVIPGWAHTDDVWVCVRGCGYTAHYSPREELPFDQDAAQLVVETQAYLKGLSA